MPTALTLDRARLAALMEREEATFIADHPRSATLHERAKGALLAGVPMNWMVKWPGAFPPYVESASGAHFTCVDGHDYVDFCLGDTGSRPAGATSARRSIPRSPLESCRSTTPTRSSGRSPIGR